MYFQMLKIVKFMLYTFYILKSGGENRSTEPWEKKPDNGDPGWSACGWNGVYKWPSLKKMGNPLSTVAKAQDFSSVKNILCKWERRHFLLAESLHFNPYGAWTLPGHGGINLIKGGLCIESSLSVGESWTWGQFYLFIKSISIYWAPTIHQAQSQSVESLEVT